jgi:hypothetical protein
MRFSKAEVLEAFDREDTSYRLAVLSSHWLRDTARFKPNVADQARGLKMQVRGRWISYTDIADKFEQQKDRDLIVSDFLLTQLHNLIRAPLEILCDYCDDYDKHDPAAELRMQLKNTGWYYFAPIIRNAVSHNFRYDFNKSDRQRLPLSWQGITLSEDLQGKPMTYETFWHKPGYELFLEMRDFAEALPTIPVDQA